MDQKLYDLTSSSLIKCDSKLTQEHATNGKPFIRHINSIIMSEFQWLNLSSNKPTKDILFSIYSNALLGKGVLCHVVRLSIISYEAVVRN